MKSNRVLVAVAGLCVVSFLLLGSFWKVPAQAQGGIKNPKIILASGLGPPYMLHPVVTAKGFMTKYGLEPQLQVFSGGLDAVRAVGGGAAQITNAGQLSVLSPRSKGADYLAVGSVLVNTSDLGVAVVRSINGPKDLSGKRCAVELGGSGEYYLHRYLSVYKLNPQDLKIINMSPPEWIPAMVRGDIDCFFGWEPWLTQLPKIVAGAKVIHRNGQDRVFVVHQTLLFNAKWIRDDLEAAKAALRGMIDTLSWLNTHRSEAAAIAGKAFQTDSNELLQQMTCCVYRLLFDQEQVDSLTEAARWGSEKGLWDIKADVLIRGLLYPDLLKSVAAERCTAEVCRQRRR